MKEISRRQAAIGQHNPVTNTTTIVETQTIVVVQDYKGQEIALSFDHDPTDDELIAQLPSEPKRRNIKPTNVADRVDAGAELAARYLALRQLTDLPDFTTLFTAGERTRITQGRDLALADIKAYI